MKDCYDLKNPRKNPYAERMKNGYTIIIDRDPDNDDKGKTSDETPFLQPQLQPTHLVD